MPEEMPECLQEFLYALDEVERKEVTNFFSQPEAIDTVLANVVELQA